MWLTFFYSTFGNHLNLAQGKMMKMKLKKLNEMDFPSFSFFLQVSTAFVFSNWKMFIPSWTNSNSVKWHDHDRSFSTVLIYFQRKVFIQFQKLKRRWCSQIVGFFWNWFFFIVGLQFFVFFQTSGINECIYICQSLKFIYQIELFRYLFSKIVANSIYKMYANFPNHSDNHKCLTSVRFEELQNVNTFSARYFP